MKAVNLIPLELRRVTRSGPTKTGPAPYILLGALAAVVVLVGVWALGASQIADGRADLARTNQEADAAEQRAEAVAPFSAFAAVREKRVAGVTGLARSRFDWPFALRELSRVLPRDVTLTNITGAVAPGTDAAGGSSGAGGSGEAATAKGPSITLAGCARSQTSVARYLVQLRRVTGVTKVALTSSAKGGEGGAGAAGAAAGSEGGGCDQGTGAATFALTVAFETSKAKPASEAAQGGGGAAASGAPATAAPATGAPAS